MGHVTGDEKYDCVIWNEATICSMMTCGSVYWESLRGSFFSILYLYRWNNYTISFSNDCMGGSKLYG